MEACIASSFYIITNMKTSWPQWVITLTCPSELNLKFVLQISDQDFHGHFYCFTGTLFEFFHGKRFFFHGWNLTKIFTGTICISRALFGQKLVFFTGGFFFFMGKKKNTARYHVGRCQKITTR